MPGVGDRWVKDVPLGWFAVGATAFAAAVAVRRRPCRDAGALAGALVAGLAAGASWQVLAVNHMCVHRHINLVVYAVPFLPLAYLTCGWLVGRLAIGRPLGVGAVATCAVLMAANAAAEPARRATEADAQVAAGRFVEGWLAAGGSSDGGLVGVVDRCDPASRQLHGVLCELGLFDPATGGPSDPGALVLHGWVRDARSEPTGPGPWVVLVGGDGRAITCTVRRCRRADLDRVAGRPLPRAAFAAVVPGGALPVGAVPRVFVVSGTEPTRVRELAVP